MSSFFCKKKRGVQIVHLSWKALGHQFVNLMTLTFKVVFYSCNEMPRYSKEDKRKSTDWIGKK